MKNKKKQNKPQAPRNETATPFFVRYLEGQSVEPDAEAKISGKRRTARATTGGAKKSAKKKAAPPKLVTLKFPSDNDEYVLYPYHIDADVKVVNLPPKFETRKFPSDNDEYGPYFPVYINRADVPKTATTKAAAQPKAAPVSLSRKKPKG